MALKRPSTLLLTLPPPTRTLTSTHTHHRALHALNKPNPRIPKPTPFVPDVPTFLTLIGRQLSQHASKIPTWEGLFTLSSAQLKASGVEPPRARRYLLWWRERYRNGVMGVGGDVTEVKDGVAELRVVEVPSKRFCDAKATLTRGAGMRKVVVNVTPTVSLPADPAAAPAEEGEGRGRSAAPMRVDAKKAKEVKGVRIVAANGVGGKGVEPVKGYVGVARLRVKEGLWEERRGHKVDGGERRKAEVRYKRAAAERRNAR